MIQRFSKVTSCHGRIVTRYERRVSPPGAFPQFVEFVSSNLPKTGKERNAIYSDQVVYPFVQRSELVSLLHEHLFNNLIKVTEIHLHTDSFSSTVES